MNILMLLFKDLYNDARVQREANALAEAGYNVDIACILAYQEFSLPILHPNIDIHRYMLKAKRLKRKNKSEKVFYILRKMYSDISAAIEFYNKAKNIIKTKQIDAIHCHDLNTLPFGYFLAKKFKKKLVYDSHELYNEMVNKNRLERKIGYIVEKFFIQGIEELIVVNPYAREWFKDRYNVSSITIVQNIPDVQMSKEPKKLILRDYYSLNPEDHLILYQGGLTPDRGVEECIEAIGLLPSIYKMIIIGDGIYKDELIEYARKINVMDRVYFFGSVPSEHLLYYTKQANIGLVMYKNTCLNNFYSTPNKIFEYILSGVPVVSSDHPGKRYIINETSAGICVSEDPKSIAQGIKCIIDNIEYYKRQCEANKYKFSWNNEAKNLVDMYERLLNGEEIK